MRKEIKSPSNLKRAEVCEQCLNEVKSCCLCDKGIGIDFMCIELNNKPKHICGECIRLISEELEIKLDG
jgi:hypothetical protein